MNDWRFWTVEDPTVAAQVPDELHRPARTRKEATKPSGTGVPAAEASESKAGDYLIDGDGRPISENERASPVEEE